MERRWRGGPKPSAAQAHGACVVMSARGPFNTLLLARCMIDRAT